MREYIFLRTIGIFIFLLLSFSIAMAEQCRLEDSAELDYLDIECQFYMGTTAYRHNLYSVAAEHWKFIQGLPVENTNDEELKAIALGTLTYLTYKGLGVKQNRRSAVKTWEEAAKQGALEPRRHLGFAFSDDNYIFKNQVKALGWYESIFILYPTVDGLEESDRTIYQGAIEDAEILRNKLGPRQIERALEFAKTTF